MAELDLLVLGDCNPDLIQRWTIPASRGITYRDTGCANGSIIELRGFPGRGEKIDRII